MKIIIPGAPVTANLQWKTFSIFFFVFYTEEKSFSTKKNQEGYVIIPSHLSDTYWSWIRDCRIAKLKNALLRLAWSSGNT